MIKRTRAICGVAVCGKTVCGDTSEPEEFNVSLSDIQAVAVIKSSDGWFIYYCPIVSGKVTINNPYNRDNADITIIHSGNILTGYEISIQVGKGMKQEIFNGIIESETKTTFITQGKIMSTFNCVNKFNTIEHKYLTKDVSFGGSVKSSIDRFIELAEVNITNNSNNDYDAIDLLFEKYDLTLLDILHRIIADYCNAYVSGDSLIISDITDTVEYCINTNAKVVSFDSDKSKTNQYRKCIVNGDNGVQATAIDETANSVKEMVVNDDSILTYFDALSRAKRELETANKETESATVKVSGFIFPNFGNIKLNLNSYKNILELKSIVYEFGLDGIFTTLYLGKSYKTIDKVFIKMKEILR